MAKSITVIVPAYNASATIKDCVDSLLNQTLSSSCYEIIVVNDGSTDDTARKLREYVSNGVIKFLHSYINKGPAWAKNMGVKSSEGQIVLFTGADCIAHRCLLEEHLRSHEKRQNVAVLGHTEWNPGLKKTPLMEYLSQNMEQFAYWAISDESNVSHYLFYTTNASVKREQFANIGLFDETFRFAAWEDIDLGYRLRQNGATIIYNKGAKVYHNHKVSISSFIKRQIRAGRSAVILHTLHPELESNAVKWLKKIGVPITNLLKAALAFGYPTVRLMELMTASVDTHFLASQKVLWRLYKYLFLCAYALGVKEESLRSDFVLRHTSEGF